MAPKEIRTVVKKFKSALRKAKFPTTQMLIFGSYARGEARPDSDIDICMISKIFNRHNKEGYRKKAVLIAFEVDPRIQVVVVDPRELKTNTLSPLLSHIRRESIAA